MKKKDIGPRLESIDNTLVRLTVTVEDHVRRTNLLEESIKPIQKHVSMVEGAVKFIGLLGILAAITEAIRRVML